VQDDAEEEGIDLQAAVVLNICRVVMRCHASYPHRNFLHAAELSTSEHRDAESACTLNVNCFPEL